MKTLIVEDDLTSRILLQELLQAHGVAHVAVNGREAVDAARVALETQEPYDLICMDIMMPEMDGEQAVRNIRAVEEAAGVIPPDGSKIIMTTARSDAKSMDGAYRSLCNAYLVKPISARELEQELRYLQLVP